MVLRSSGFDVRTATSVESALAALGSEQFNLLVSDIGLPDGSGLDIMRHWPGPLGAEGDRLQRLRDRLRRAGEQGGRVRAPPRQAGGPRPHDRPGQADGVVIPGTPPLECDGVRPGTPCR